MANEQKHYNGIDLQGQKAINAANPTNPQDLATKDYVDNNVPTSSQRTFAFFAG